MSPYDGFRPTTPQYEAGKRVDPPVSVPSALAPSLMSTSRQVKQDNEPHARHIPDATAAALPPELPPADLLSTTLRSDILDGGWKGLTTGPCTEWVFRDL